MPGYPSDAQIDAHVLAESLWEQMIGDDGDDADTPPDGSKKVSEPDYMEDWKRHHE